MSSMNGLAASLTSWLGRGSSPSLNLYSAELRKERARQRKRQRREWVDWCYYFDTYFIWNYKHILNCLLFYFWINIEINIFKYKTLINIFKKFIYLGFWGFECIHLKLCIAQLSYCFAPLIAFKLLQSSL